MSVPSPRIVVPSSPDKADHDIIYARLVECEAETAGAPEILPLAVLIKDEAGATLGGLWGNTVFRWLVVQLVFIPAEFRGSGIGTRLMSEAEAVARQRGCIGVWLDTYSFQAPDFYAKLGYAPFGDVGDHPPGHRRIFMRKSLV